MLYCVLCVWNEEDIIGSTVTHAYAQGCDRVFIIDNGSTDETVRQAVKAGAHLYTTFSTRYFDEIRKTLYINRCAEDICRQAGGDRNWILYLDADEFPEFHNGKSIRQNLLELPENVRAVGGYVCNHVPTHSPYFIRGRHPVDFMPVGKIQRQSIWKYNLLRHDRDKPRVLAGSGSHEYLTQEGDSLERSDTHFIIHHFNYRRPDDMQRRLGRLLERDEKGISRIDNMDMRHRVLTGRSSPYHARLERLAAVYEENRHLNLETDRLEYDFSTMCRWYNPMELDRSLDGETSPLDRHIFRGTICYHLKKYEQALFAFNDALMLASEEPLRCLLLLCMGRCYREMNDPTLKTLTRILLSCPDEKIGRLAEALTAPSGQERDFPATRS